MNKIKFSHKYFKMPEPIRKGECHTSMLLAVLNTTKDQLGYGFIEYDTRAVNDDKYELPEGRLMVLLLLSSQLWTTVRRWSPEKEKYYRSKIGEVFEIEISETIN